MSTTDPFEDKWAKFREMWWMDDAVNEHGAVEAEYEQMYNLWYMTEAEFWGPMVGASEALRFGYSDDKRAWTMVKRVNSLDRHVPQWVRSMRFRGVEAA